MDKKEKHEPVRTCVVCRKRFPKKELTRYVCPEVLESGKGLMPDPEMVMPGRGYYLCDNPGCRDGFKKFKGWLKKCKGVFINGSKTQGA